jgi:CRP-like cAMP-binding protein
MSPSQGRPDETTNVTSFALFAGISEDQAERLRAAMSPIRLRRGDVLFREGDEADKLYLIQTGKMKLGTSSPGNRENLLAVLGKGEIIGELTLFDPGARTATATAVTSANLLQLSHEAFVEWLDQNPAASMQLLKALAQRLRRTNEVVGGLVFFDVPGRIAKALLDLAEQFGEETADGTQVVQHHLTQEELAHLVGSSRETVNKTLTDFANRGWIKLDGRSVRLLDRAHLARRSAAAP